MTCTYNRRLYKGNSYEIELPFSYSTTLGDLTVTFYTDGEVKVIKDLSDITLSGDTMVMTLTAEDLEYLKDGVLYYTVEYDGDEYGEYTTNSPYVVATPIDYSGNTLEVLLEEAFDSGYTSGLYDCSGETCESAWTEGYSSGYTDGRTNGYQAGKEAGFESGYTNGIRIARGGCSPYSFPLTFNVTSPGVIEFNTVGDVVHIGLFPFLNGELIGPYEPALGTSGWLITGSVEVQAGDVLELYDGGYNFEFNSCSLTNYITFCGTTCGFEIEGNIMSLMNQVSWFPDYPAEGPPECWFPSSFERKEGCEEYYPLPTEGWHGSYMFHKLFLDCTGLTSAENLALPTDTLPNCYDSMFKGCTNLKVGPELPAEAPMQGAYEFMFSGCTNLNYVKCLADDLTATGSTYNWLSDVSPTGGFLTPSTTNWSTGTSGIPTGWTRINI